ncbi:hypothetical protein [Streptomyces sp. NPDC048612]|uniref:hypothetical protein n=1 Tax=Streptomyces sp. NPDC048612 TaxID=3365579 RepID=UPI0037140F4A
MADDQARRVDDSEFLEITRDPAAASIMRKSLEQLAKGGAGDVLKEMADEILSGRVGVRDAVSIPVYANHMIDKLQASKQEWDSLSEMDRERLAADGERFLEGERREIEESEREKRDAAGRGAKGRHDGSTWSLY